MKIEIDFPINYKLIKNKSNKLLILLHGFAQSNTVMLKHFQNSIPDDYDILIPNGPFPIPKIRKDYIEKRYAWYFFNRHTNTYEIDYKLPSKLISGLVDKLGYQNTEKVIVGYSQGGYLSPFTALELQNVSRIIGLCCTYKWQFLPEVLPFDVYSIHGSDDLMVDHQNSKEHFQKIKVSDQSQSNYITIDGQGHDLNENIVNEVKKLL